MRRPASFLDKNVVPAEIVASNALLAALLEAGDTTLVVTDQDGTHRFAADFANRSDVVEALDRLTGDDRWRGLVATHRNEVLDLYEDVFGHHGYTGRSGSMYGYEGIGSIYWHMVAKLLVAVQHAVVDAAAERADEETRRRLVDAYWRVRAGLGFNKSAADFGAIPLDPYSHTPAHAGAQQPGMTGLVKEELLTRPLELGVRVVDGAITIDPVLVRGDELLDAAETWTVYDVGMQPREIELTAGQFAMTVCQVPLIVTAGGDAAAIEVVGADGTTRRIDGLDIGRATSEMVFGRTGAIDRIEISLPRVGAD